MKPKKNFEKDLNRNRGLYFVISLMSIPKVLTLANLQMRKLSKLIHRLFWRQKQ